MLSIPPRAARDPRCRPQLAFAVVIGLLLPTQWALADSGRAGRAEDHVFATVGYNGGIVTAGGPGPQSADTGPAIGGQFAAGIRSGADYALYIEFADQIDLLVSGISTSSIGGGVMYFFGENMYVAVAGRYRETWAGSSLGDVIGEVIGEVVICGVFGSGPCGPTEPEIVGSTMRDLGFKVGLGAEWQLWAFTVGIEFIAVDLPLIPLDAEVQIRLPDRDELITEPRPNPGLNDVPLEVRFGTVEVGLSF